MPREQTTRTPDEIKAEVLASAQSGAFVSDIDKHRWSLLNGEFQIAAAAAAQLHNEGTHDFLQYFSDGMVQPLGQHAFFDVQHFFCAVLPSLDAPATEVVPLVVTMVRKAGGDGVAGQPYLALREWASRNAQRPTAILAEMNDDAKVDFGAVSVALQAGAMLDKEHYVDRATALMSDPVALRRRAAMSALGKFDLSTSPALRDQALDALAALCAPGADDAECATALGSIVEIFAREPSVLAGRVEPLVRAAGNGPHTLHSLADALFIHRKVLTEAMIDAVLEALRGVPAANTGTVQEIDMALSRMPYPANRERVAEFLEAVALRSADTIPVERFEHLTRNLLTEHMDTFIWLAIRWLRLGRFALCQALSAIIQHTGSDSVALTADLSAFTDKERVFIARKAVGFFPLQPYAAASVIVSAMRGASKSTATTLSDLLFEMVLLNYSGARDRVAALAKQPTDPAAKYVKKALKLHDDYAKGLDAAQKLPELHPSERQRRAAFDRQRAFSAQIFKHARERSILASIMHNVTVLYGHKTVDYVDTGDGELRRVESNMQPHGTTWEWPRLDTVDPTGFQFRTHLLRTERFSE